jgi:uncharacterized SAM-binding protein YcdF (DUF218 family)
MAVVMNIIVVIIIIIIIIWTSCCIAVAGFLSMVNQRKGSVGIIPLPDPIWNTDHAC